jgi:hypothetical protein
MPIRQYLNGQQFDPETVRVMGLAFEISRVALQLADRDDPANQIAANKVIEIAQAGERDPERICERVLAALRSSPSSVTAMDQPS